MKEKEAVLQPSTIESRFQYVQKESTRLQSTLMAFFSRQQYIAIFCILTPLIANGTNLKERDMKLSENLFATA